jgi:hypothetical protein
LLFTKSIVDTLAEVVRQTILPVSDASPDLFELLELLIIFFAASLSLEFPSQSVPLLNCLPQLWILLYSGFLKNKKPAGTRGSIYRSVRTIVYTIAESYCTPLTNAYSGVSRRGNSGLEKM